MRKTAGGHIDVSFDQTALRGELCRVFFHDLKSGAIVHFKGDKIMGYVPLDPDKSVSLGTGEFVGVDRDFELPPNAKYPLSAIASVAYKNFGRPVDSLWEGLIKSPKIKIQ